MKMPCRVTDVWDKEFDGTEDKLGYISDFNAYLLSEDYDGQAPIKTIQTPESPWIVAEARKKAAEQQKRVEAALKRDREYYSRNNKRYFTGL
jgi:hypothetical protein